MVSEIVRPDWMKLACLFAALAIALSMLLGCGVSSGISVPAILPVGGTYAYNPVLSLTDTTPGASIYYTTDGSTPTTSSALYSSSTFLEINQNETVNAIAVAGGSTSPMTTAAYTINLPPAPTPVLSPAPGGFTSAPAVTITDSALGASIYYTTDGSTPTTSSNLYSGPITVTGVETLNAVAISRSYGYGYSAVGGGAYVVLLPPVFSLAAGTYSSTQQLTISDTAPSASIYYTTDGSVPTTSSTLYRGPISIASTEAVSAIATMTVAGSSATSLVTTDSYAIHPPGTSLVLSGTAVSGQPVVGASIQLYAVGATGYLSAAVPLLTSPLTSDSTGAFSLPGKYTCTAGSYLYLTASGGTTAGHAQNQNLTLAAALGLCNNLTAASSFTVNEETTVAAAYALAQFSKGTAFGHALLGQQGSQSSSPADNFATSSTNMVGLANAMAVSEILASPSTGGIGNNSNGSALPEWWQMNLIANMLASCVRSDGGSANDGTACGTLFGNVIFTGGAAPADTLQAALDLALTPTVSSMNIANLYGLISLASAPFQPYPATASAITDFTVGIEYQPVSGAVKLLSQPSGIAIDSLGNAWIGNQPTSGGTAPYPAYLVELTPTGVPIQAGTTSDSYVVNSYKNSSTSQTQTMGGQYISTAAPVGQFVPSIDTNNNVWFNDKYNSVVGAVTGSGTTYSPSQTYQNGGNASAVGTALAAASEIASTYVDGNNSVWWVATNNTNPPANCQVGQQGGQEGIGVFLNGSPTDIYFGKTGNAVQQGQFGYLAVDPNKADTVGGTEIPGAPFVWTIGFNTNAPLLLQFFTELPATGSNNPACTTPLDNIGVGPASPVGTDPTVKSTHATGAIPDIPNPAVSGDYLHFVGYPADWTFDKSGKLWIANTNAVKSSVDFTLDTNNSIWGGISEVTPAYGASLSSSSASDFTFSVYHNVAGMYDGSSSSNNPPSFLTTDGAGNVWFTLTKNSYVNAMTSAGVGLAPNTGATGNTTAGFAGSSCVACTYNGSTQTYQRPSISGTLSLARPVIDQSGDVWVPVQGVGSTYIDLLVGAAVPRTNPDSLGLKNNTFAAEP